MNLKAPFPWFGGKSRVADQIWERLGDPPNYVEPFFGSGAVLLARPGGAGKTETVNDADGFLANFWRAIRFAPEQVAHWADWPVNENDLHARNFYLTSLREEFCKRLEGDPTYYDPLIAGWWVWGLSCWIGSGFAQWTGPWRSVGGLFVKADESGVTRKLPHLGDAGRGTVKVTALQEWLDELSGRMSKVRVCCGDWTRCMGDSVPILGGLGRYYGRNAVEFLSYGVTNSSLHWLNGTQEPNYILAPKKKNWKGRYHSRKPDEAYEFIIRNNDGKRLSLFQIDPREGFICFGSDLPPEYQLWLVEQFGDWRTDAPPVKQSLTIELFIPSGQQLLFPGVAV